MCRKARASRAYFPWSVLLRLSNIRHVAITRLFPYLSNSSPPININQRNIQAVWCEWLTAKIVRKTLTSHIQCGAHFSHVSHYIILRHPIAHPLGSGIMFIFFFQFWKCPIFLEVFYCVITDDDGAREKSSLSTQIMFNMQWHMIIEYQHHPFMLANRILDKQRYYVSLSKIIIISDLKLLYHDT